jgi:beta-galactosidase
MPKRGGSMNLKRALSGFLTVVAAAVTVCFAETYVPESSNRVTINLGETPWLFLRADPSMSGANGPQSVAYNDASWTVVGIPHTWNDTDTFVNEDSGGDDGTAYGGTNWYRKHFTLDSKYADRKVFIEFEGAHVGAQVYINGTFLPGNSATSPNATHVTGFMGFVVDITPYARFGGADNVLAVRVSKNNAFYQDPGFSLVFRFGQADGGLFRPVWMHITDKVHVPLNLYSVLGQWGTYVAATTVSDASATVLVQTNVRNDGAAGADVSLTTQVVDASNNVVLTLSGAHTIGTGQSYAFSQTGDIANPHLWYPNNSVYGGPYMYKVYHIVKVGGVTVDVFQSPLGIRVLTWDKDFPYYNGHKHFLWGASARYDYPALGTAVPEEQQWRDAKLLSDCGGNLWRPGHSPCSPEFVAACDAFGVALVQPSGEHEGACGGCNASLKAEVHRDMIIRDRNHPSVLAWEVSNGPINTGLAQQCKALSVQWDSIHTRVQADRTPSPANGDILACTATGCEIGVKRNFPNNPAWGAEDWSNYGRLSRWGYDKEIAFIADYLQEWVQSQKNNCFGLAQWYLAETPGEAGFFLDRPNATERSFGCSMVDFNRIPKFLYHAYRVCWTPFAIRPQIAIAHHWNRSGSVKVNVFSNCDSVRLLINGKSQGTKKPNPVTGVDPDNDHTQDATQLPCQCTWTVAWEAGTLRAEGLDKSGNVVCSEEKKTAGPADHVALSVEPPLVRPDGGKYEIRANGTDAAFILAKVVDSAGNWCPLDSHTIVFSVSGSGNYRGGSDQMVYKDKPKTYHAPIDSELRMEGGMCKIAVRSVFTHGPVTVSSVCAGLPHPAATTTFTVYPVTDPPVSLVKPVGSSGSRAAPVFATAIVAGNLRYYLSRPASVRVDMISASGKVMRSVPASKQTEGWHPVQVAGSGNGGRLATGVYIVRIGVDGEMKAARRVVVFR